MPSFVRAAAVAAFAAVASAQFTNTTLPAAALVPGWTYEGCSISSAAGGALVESSAFMTPARCTLDCSAYDFAFIQGTDCYCSDSLNGTAPVADSQCSTRCPGNPGQACGGASPNAKRQAAGTVVSVYQKQAVVAVGVIYLTVINNIYVDYCPELQKLTTVTYLSTATLTGCGCTTTPKPYIPVTTTLFTCPIAGTTTVVTLTVPTAVVPGKVTTGVATITAPVTTVVACPTCPAGSVTSTISACPGCAVTTAVVVVPSATKPAISTFTGAASNVKVGSGLLAGAIAAAALL